MTLPSKWLRARRLASDDEGTTLLELMVGMTVMSIFMAIFTSAVVSMFSSANKIEAVDNSSAQLATAFDRLDTQVRYAAVILQPVQLPDTVDPTTLDWSVAFLTDGETSTTCTQLVIRKVTTNSLQQLAEHTWTVVVNSDGSSSASDNWTQLAIGVTLLDQNGAPVTPFLVSTPTGATAQQLELRLVALDGAGQSQSKSFSQITFSALNSAPNSTALASAPTGSVC